MHSCLTCLAFHCLAVMARTVRIHDNEANMYRRTILKLQTLVAETVREEIDRSSDLCHHPLV